MDTSAFHQSIQQLLGSLAALDPAVGPTELCCDWFDDLYFPGEPQWSASFSDPELRAMAEFNKVFESLIGALPMEGTPWQTDPQWTRISEAASVALASFSRDAA